MTYTDDTARFEFKIDPSNGCYIGPMGCHYDEDELPKAMYFDQLNLCGCGGPESIHAMLIDCLKKFDRDVVGGGIGYSPLQEITDIVKENPEVVAEFIAHFLDQKNLIEHGSSVYGSWLTERGKQFIEIGSDWNEQ